MLDNMNVCLGGTFYPLHKGHKALLSKAFQVAGPNGSVFIGLTSDTIANEKGRIAPYENRKKTIERFIKENNLTKHVTIQPLLDAYGPSIDGEFDAIVVSSETQATAQEINRRRKKSGKNPLQIIVIPLILAEDNKPISSTRIRNGEIDEKGIALNKE